MSDRQATCSCGNLVVRTHGDPVRNSICHCFACQKRTGSPFGARARFEIGAVRVAGRSKEYVRIAESGNAVRFQFCPDCGSTVAWQLDALSGFITVPIGAFADPHFPQPEVSVFEEHQHSWVQLPGGMEHLA
ncbi:GFA family protein [Dokdonella sp.]|uniref:GFA family protein n=1 Tax=Dokdonella sp. TaxID=2291710 RepID=UPI0039C89308